MQKYHNDKHNKFYMNLALEAAKNSVAQRKQVGACIVLPNGLISLGWNGTPSGFSNNCEDMEGLTKPDVIHAEINALKKLIVAGQSVVGARLFVTHSPCINCSINLIDLGLKEVCFLEYYKDTSGLDLLERSGVSINELSPV